MKIYTENNGYVLHDVCNHNGMHTITLQDSADNILDKIRVDTASMARDYVRAFRKIAKNKESTSCIV